MFRGQPANIGSQELNSSKPCIGYEGLLLGESEFDRLEEVGDIRFEVQGVSL